jgi:hypothetical protein
MMIYSYLHLNYPESQTIEIFINVNTKITRIILTCLSMVLLILITRAQNNSSGLTGPYLGQKLPGMIPEIFASGVVSTDYHEFGITFSPDGKEIFFTRMKPDERIQRIMYTAEVKNVWKEPEIANFSGQYADMEPCFLPNGKEIYFVSFRPVPGFEGMTADIWSSEKKDGKWSKAKHLKDPFNPGKAMYFTFSEDGTLYTTNAENRGGILTSTMDDGRYSDLKKLGNPFDTGTEAHPCIAHDESYLIFDAVGDAGRGLYVSFKNKSGSWDSPVSLKEYTGEGGIAAISPDGKYLFYTDKGDIYWVDAKIIEELKPIKLK